MNKKLKYYKTAIIAVLSFMFGCMLTVNLTSIDKTCQMENSDGEYNMMINSKWKNPELIVLIMSAPKNLDKRNIVRQTWLQLYDDGSNVKFKMKYYFVLGSWGLSTDEILHLSTEQSQFSDILILPMYDGYQNLTLKIINSFEWLNQQYEFGLKFKYVLKCDDDSFVRIDKLMMEFDRIEDILKTGKLQSNDPYIRINSQINNFEEINDLQLYWGYFDGNANIQKSGKWKEINWVACDKYVPYALGGGYILSKKLISFIANNKDNLRIYNSEDVSVGMWLASIKNVVRIHDIRFDTEWISRGCQNVYFITHNISKDEMKKMYNNIINTNNLCATTVLKRNYYLYNWNVLPSQCCNNKVK